MSEIINTINSIIYDLQAEGFVHTFSVIQGEIGCSGTGKFYKPTEIKIVKQHNFDANPYANARAVIYALETNDGYKGVLINRYGMYADKTIEKFMQKASVNA